MLNVDSQQELLTINKRAQSSFGKVWTVSLETRVHMSKWKKVKWNSWDKFTILTYFRPEFALVKTQKPAFCFFIQEY